MEAESGLSGFIRLREDLIAGDYRLLYLAWLKAMTISEEWIDDYGYVISYPDHEPPVPAGLKKLSPGLKHFIDIFELDPFLVLAAAEASENLTTSPRVNYRQLVARLPREESDAFLADLAGGRPGVAPALRKRLLAYLPEQKSSRRQNPRTLQQLLDRAKALEHPERKHE
jgi:hypothetical protein